MDNLLITAPKFVDNLPDGVQSLFIVSLYADFNWSVCRLKSILNHKINKTYVVENFGLPKFSGITRENVLTQHVFGGLFKFSAKFKALYLNFQEV